MAKKFLAIILSVLMLMSVFAVSASAAAEQSKFETKVEEALGLLIGNGEEVEVEAEAAFVNALKKNGTSSSRLVKSMSNYAVVAAEDVDEIDAVAQAIADGTAYNVVVLEDGRKTVYISVDIVANPELFDEEVFRAAVVKIVDKQNDVIPLDEVENFDLLDYNRFAGELYLHMFLYHVLEPFKDIEWLPTVQDAYARVARADMDITETRVPGILMTAIGYVLLELLGTLGI